MLQKVVYNLLRRRVRSPSPEVILAICVTLGKTFNLSEPCFLICEVEITVLSISQGCG